MRQSKQNRISAYLAELAPEDVHELRREVLGFADLTVEKFLKIKITKDSSLARAIAADLGARALGLRSRIRPQHLSQLEAIELIADLVETGDD